MTDAELDDLQKRLLKSTASSYVCQGCADTEREEAAEAIAAAQARIAALETFSLKALTVIEWVAGEGFVLQSPHYDADDLFMEGVDLLDVADANAARAALAKGEMK